MKRVTILLALLFSLTTKGQTPANDSHWQLLWEDNFNTINTGIWEVKNNWDHYYDTGPVPNGEEQVYTDRTDNVFIDNGTIVLRAKQELYPCPPSAVNQWDCKRQYYTGLDYEYTAGFIETKQAFNVHYGYLEARIKLPYGNGLWPAFWAFSQNPNYEEIDIFEMIPGAIEYCNPAQFTHHKNIMTTNIHLQGPDGTCTDPYDDPAVLIIQDYTQWHTYAIEWSPSKMLWYVDGRLVREYTNSQINTPTTVMLGLGLNPAITPYSLPADMSIDYVKVYSLDKACNEYINSCNYDFSTYDNKVKNFIKFGESGCSNSLSVGDDITLRASQFIEFTSDFYVPLGASLYADAGDDCPVDLSTQCSQKFSPCTYNFANYDNSVKKEIELGGTGCNVTIAPTTNSILLKATDKIVLKTGVTITPSTGNPVILKIVPCQ